MGDKMKNEQTAENGNEKKRSNLSKVIIFVTSMIPILGVYLLIGSLIQRTKDQEYIVKEHSDVIRYVESAEVIDKRLAISGWCFYPGVDSERNKIQVFLRNVEDETDTIWMDMESVIREDVNAYYDCDTDYRHSGFRASKKIKKVPLEGKTYEILIKLTYYVDKIEKYGKEEQVVQKEYEKTVLTNCYLCNGVLTALLPEDEPIQTESALLNEIFEKGRLMLYQRDADMYVYQYGTKMYWVAGKDFYLKESGKTTVQFQLNTTRSDLLPIERQENGHDWDNISFYFEMNELKDEATELYRVAVCDIPTEYPITRFWTGYYADSEWIWKVYRTPDISKLSK